MDDNGTPQSSHIQIQGKAMSLDTQFKHKALLPIWYYFHGHSNVLYVSKDFFPRLLLNNEYNIVMSVRQILKQFIWKPHYCSCFPGSTYKTYIKNELQSLTTFLYPIRQLTTHKFSYRDLGHTVLWSNINFCLRNVFIMEEHTLLFHCVAFAFIVRQMERLY